jgi:acetyltransferase-like isoleucine patch superfamily enzyme
MFSWGCTIIDTNAHSLNSGERLNDVIDWKKGWQYKNWSVVESKAILIKEKCWIGFNSIVMKGVTLEEGTIVAAGSVVTKTSEPYSMIGGNPARFIKKTE